MGERHKFTYTKGGAVESSDTIASVADSATQQEAVVQPQQPVDPRIAAVKQKLEVEKRTQQTDGFVGDVFDHMDTPAQTDAPKRKNAKKKTDKPEKPQKEKRKKSKAGRIVMAVVAGLLVIILATGGLGFAGVLDIGGIIASTGMGVTYYSYEVKDYDTLLRYLRHPSLKPGDTLRVSGDHVIDVAQEFGDFAVLPLVNVTGGSVKFKGGSVLLSGAADGIDMSGVSFEDCKLYIEAPQTALKLGSASDENINARTLNGSAHTRDLTLPFAGTRMTVPVTINNESGAAQSNLQVYLTSPSFLFTDGDTFIIDNLPSGGSITKDVNVVALEGGRLQIMAYATDGGNLLAFGKSDYINVLGAGFYSGDLHTHTTASQSQREGTLDGNIRAGYAHGLSFIASVEVGKVVDEDTGRETDVDVEAEKLPQGEVDAITGSNGFFLQLTAGETGENSRHLLIYDSDKRPRSDYGEVIPDYGTWTYNDAIREVTRDVEDEETGEFIRRGGFVILPHFFDYGDISASVDMAKTQYGATGIEIVTGLYRYQEADGSHRTEVRCALNVWIAINAQGKQKLFAVLTSNNLESDAVGSRYVSCNMPTLSEQNIYDSIRSGNFYSSNGPQLRFRLGGMDMGQDVSAPEGAKLIANCYAADSKPLTAVRLVKYEVTRKMEDPQPVIVYEEDLTGKGVYSFQKSIEVETAGVNEFYRFEAISEKAAYYEDVGVALSNPIWVKVEEKASASAIETISNVLGKKVQQAPNGAYYIQSAGVLPAFVHVSTTGEKVTIQVHKFGSKLLVDYVTIDVLSANGSHTVERVYLI